ncbi:MAG: lycopene cyclase domain-containing protein [Bacteroidota bacterium]
MIRFTYLAVDIGAILFPFIFSFHPKLKFYKTWFAFFPAMIISAIIFIVADIQFTRIGVWGFNPDYVTGIYFFNLPIEEYLFFFCIPYSCIFTYNCFKILLQQSPNENTTRFISKIASVVLFIIGIIYFNHLYTSTTFIALAIYLFIIAQFNFTFSVGKFFLAYFVLLIPFFICNGILTGTGLASPVVWYNNNQNLGIRILTIPVEDFFYGLLLILLNATIYERILLAKRNRN